MEHDPIERPVRVADGLDAPVRDRCHPPAGRRVAGKSVQFIGLEGWLVRKERVRVRDPDRGHPDLACRSEGAPVYEAEGLHPGADPKDRDADVTEPEKLLHLSGKEVIL